MDINHGLLTAVDIYDQWRTVGQRIGGHQGGKVCVSIGVDLLSRFGGGG